MRLLLVIFLAAMSLPVQAQDDSRWVRQIISRSRWVCDEIGCSYRPVYRWRRVRIEYPNHTYRLPPGETYSYRSQDEPGWSRRDPQSERGEFCKDAVVRVVGGAHLTKEGATVDAVRQWQSTVRYDYGEKFMDVENARGYHWRCDRASTNETIAGKVGEYVTGGQGFQRRCVVLARPCMQPVQRGDKDDK